jgi:hypothetical protein
MLSLSTVLFLFQVSVDNLNPGGFSLYDLNSSLIGAYDTGGYNLIIDPDTGIPELPAEVSTESNGFTDIFQSIKTWFKDSKGGKIIGGLYYGVPNIMKGLGMPEPFSYAIGVFWLLLASMSFVIFLRGIL